MQPMENNNALYSNLIRGCLRQERDAQQRMYNQLSGKMFAVCMRYSQSREAAEDLLQEGFLKVFTNMDKFRHDGSFEGWVRRIMVNTAVEHFRRENRMYPVLSLDASEANRAIALPETGLEVQDLVRLIQELSPGYRTIFNLYAVEGYSHKEIADMLQISEGTSKSQLARARYNLMERMEQLYSRSKNGTFAR